MDFKLHPVEWNDEKVGRFWDNWHSSDEQPSFAQSVGKELLQYCRGVLKDAARVHDYGCGYGPFIRAVLDSTMLPISGSEFAPETVKRVNEAFSNEPRFEGCYPVTNIRNDLQGGSISVLFGLEVIEHFTHDRLDESFDNFRHLLPDRGILVLTTPNCENLGEKTVTCPDCGCQFHTIQHLRSFNKQSMSNLVESYGFRVLRCNAVNLWELKWPSLLRKADAAARRVFSKRDYRNLVCFATKG